MRLQPAEIPSAPKDGDNPVPDPWPSLTLALIARLSMIPSLACLLFRPFLSVSLGCPSPEARRVFPCRNGWGEPYEDGVLGARSRLQCHWMEAITAYESRCLRASF